ELLATDLTVTAEGIEKAIGSTGFDLVIAGDQSTDGSAGMLPARLAERLGVPLASALSDVEITKEKVSGARLTDDGVAQVSASLPAVISITEANPAGRFTHFKGVMAAKKKPVEGWTQ